MSRRCVSRVRGRGMGQQLPAAAGKVSILTPARSLRGAPAGDASTTDRGVNLELPPRIERHAEALRAVRRTERAHAAWARLRGKPSRMKPRRVSGSPRARGSAQQQGSSTSRPTLHGLPGPGRRAPLPRHGGPQQISGRILRGYRPAPPGRWAWVPCRSRARPNRKRCACCSVSTAMGRGRRAPR